MEEENKTGEISKNALKKLQKAEEAAKKKALKDQEKAQKKESEPATAKSKLVADDAEDLDPTQYYENRLKFIHNIEDTNGISAYPHKYFATLRISEYIEKFNRYISF